MNEKYLFHFDRSRLCNHTQASILELKKMKTEHLLFDGNQEIALSRNVAIRAAASGSINIKSQNKSHNEEL